jgi:hypothetical protein
MRSDQALKDAPWGWTIELHNRCDKPEPHQGYAADPSSAMTAFALSGGRSASANLL